MYTHKINEGWICPKCGRIYAPSITMCLPCYNEQLDEIKKNQNLNSIKNFIESLKNMKT